MKTQSDKWLSDLTAFLKTPTIIAGSDQMWEPKPSDPDHFHSYYQMDYFYKGHGYVMISNTKIDITPGDLIICNPNEPHSGEASQKDPMESICFKFELLGTSPKPRFPNNISNLHLLSHDQQWEMERFLRQACVEANSGSEDSPQLAASLISVFFIYLLRYLKELRRLTQDENSKGDVGIIYEYIKKHSSREISMHDLARISGLHPKYLCHKFSSTFGIPPMLALTHERIESAKKLLAYTMLPIGEIAARVGFPEIFHFSKRFKEIAGISPAAYRKLHR